MNVPNIITGLLACCFAVALSGCKNSESSSANANASPDDLQIVFGQTGGFAGRMTGHTVDASGRVTAWEGKFVGENKRGESDESRERALALWRAASEAGILETSEQAMGNMTWFVTVSTGDSSRTVSWASWPANDASLTAAQKFYRTCEAAARAALSE